MIQISIVTPPNKSIGSLYGRARTKTFRLIDIKCVLYVLPSWWVIYTP